MPSTTKLFGLVLTARAGRRPSRTRGYGLVITDVDVARARARETRRGTDAMRCLRLSDKGVLRWHTDCCRTPIGNTAASPRFPAPAADRRPAFVSISHLLNAQSQQRLGQQFFVEDRSGARAHARRRSGCQSRPGRQHAAPVHVPYRGGYCPITAL